MGPARRWGVATTSRVARMHLARHRQPGDSTGLAGPGRQGRGTQLPGGHGSRGPAGSSACLQEGVGHVRRLTVHSLPGSLACCGPLPCLHLVACALRGWGRALGPSQATTSCGWGGSEPTPQPSLPAVLVFKAHASAFVFPEMLKMCMGGRHVVCAEFGMAAWEWHAEAIPCLPHALLCPG